MAAATSKSRYRKIIRLLLIFCGVLVLAVAGLHIWFVNNARGVLIDMVHTKSKGKIKLELSKLSFDFFSNKLKVREADLVSTDSLTQPTTYHIKFRKLTLRVNSFWPLILQKRLLLDSIKLHDPEVEVMQWRKDTTTKRTNDELSITQEMGKLYNSMLDVLDDFGIRRIIINNAKLSLVNKMKTLSDPVVISNIYFDLVRTAEDVKKRDEFVPNEQSINLTTTDQHINLPGGRHRLSFKNFHLELLSKRIQLDSCTISALATDSTKSSYTIFFKSLMLVGVDFEAMYRQNLIKADSVYCENPLFKINLNTLGSVKNKKSPPNPEEIVQELTGDLDLAFIGVKDAGIQIDITGKRNRSLFNSNKDDFEMRGLRINADSSKRVVVQRFDMLVRDYHLYNEDSSAAYTFDSIHFNNNKIVLNNFTVATEMNRARQNNYRDFSIPYFELSGLDWYELIFEQNVRAREARLFNPVIKFASVEKQQRSQKKTDLFQQLQNIGDLVALDKVSIFNGQIEMKLGATTSFTLTNADLSLFSNQLLQSKNREGLRKAVDRLSFSKGFLKLKNISASMHNVRSTPANLIRADRITLGSTNNEVKGTMNGVIIDNMLLDDLDETIVVDGVRWGSASITLQNLSKGEGKKKGGSLRLNNISGANTNLVFKNGNTTASSFIKSVGITSVIKEGTAPMKINGLLVSGNGLSFNNENVKLATTAYGVSGSGQSFISGINVMQVKGRDSMRVTAPRVEFNVDINSILAKNMQVDNVRAIRPVIKISNWSKTKEPQKKPASNSAFLIGRITAVEPDIQIRLHKADSVSAILLPSAPNSSLQATNLQLNGQGLQLGSFTINSSSATFIKPTGEVIGVEKGKVQVELSNLSLSRKDGKPTWSGLVNNLYLQNPNSLRLGKGKSSFLLNELTLGNG
ncbi:MAG TPA: hypothetical protein VM843_00935, partial [Flavisolibacter sp.]|nr:hypothetical protein [Flavisolibacter sp.]